MSDAVVGSCYCGAVKLRVQMPPKSVFHCHCSICRRLHGAPYVTWVVVDESALACEGSLAPFSSPRAVRERCGACGSPLLFRPHQAPGVVLVARACLEEDARLKPQWQGFWGDRAAWVAHDETLKTS